MSRANRPERAYDSRILRHRATWCGIVFGVASLLTFLNLLPPAGVSYHVRSEVVISSSRLAQLNDLLSTSLDREKQSAGTVQLVAVKVLDQSSHLLEGPISDQLDIALVEMNSRWSNRCTGNRHIDWLKTLTRADESELSESELGREKRFALWEMAAAQHYADRHNFLTYHGASSVATDVLTNGLDQHSSVPATLASFDRTARSDVEAGSDPIGIELQRLVDAKKQAVEKSESAWQDRVEQASGLIEVASQPEIAVQPALIPVWMVFSILVLGLSAGAIAGWVQFRLQSGGVYQPADVANQLALQGLPVAGRVCVPTIHIYDGDWMNQTSEHATVVGRGVARHLLQIGEGVVAFWFILLMIRFLLDPMWRSVLADSPLHALARILVGLP